MCSSCKICIVYVLCTLCYLFFFFFKQKTAYEMRISDWSSDVCSSDLSGCQACLDQVQCLDRADVVVLPVRPDQPLREAGFACSRASVSAASGASASSGKGNTELTLISQRT